MKINNLKRLKLFSLTVTVLLIIIVGFSSCKWGTTKVESLRLGWQPPWANQGQIVEVLKHSDVLSKNNSRVEFKPFTYGGPMTEAALAGELDILFCGDQPAITLISKDSSWRIVARMINYRSSILVPPNSPLRSVQDLKGKKIATAFGSTTHRDLVRELKAVGLEPGVDVTLVNVDQAEHAALISKGGQNAWSGVDAIATYDPTVAISVYKKNARILKEWVSPSVVVANNNVIKNRSDDLKKFLTAYAEAFVIYNQDSSKYNSLYSEESRLELPDEVYSSMAAVEPNFSAKNIGGVDIFIDNERKQIHQLNADIALDIGIIKKPIKVQEYIDLTIAENAIKQIK